MFHIEISPGTPTRVLIHFPGSEDKDKEKFFSNPTNAANYVRQQKKIYILHSVRAFIKHKRNIFSNSKSYSAEKQEAASFAENYLKDLTIQHSIQTICSRILQVRSYLNKILPHPNNASYESSLENLNTILTFCNYERNRGSFQGTSA